MIGKSNSPFDEGITEQDDNVLITKYQQNKKPAPFRAN